MINRYYEVNGALNKEYGSTYKPRPQQIKMAEGVYEALVNGENAVIEAGTGVGKSLGYLIPVAHIIKHTKEKVRALISVGTKSLQSQLWEDRGIIERIFKVKIAMMKGRASYPCMRKINKIGILLEECTNDDNELIEGYTDRQYHSDKEDCKLECNFASRCIYKTKREETLAAGIVIANNTLTTIDTSTGGKILGNFEYAIFDEAHEFPDDVRNTLSTKVTPKGMERAANEGNVTSKKLYASIEHMKKTLSNMYKDSPQDMELTPKRASEFRKILPVNDTGTDEKTVKAIESLNAQIERYNLFIEEAKELSSFGKYYSFNRSGINEKVIHVEDFFRDLDKRFKSMVFTSATIFENRERLKYFRNFIGNDFPIDRTLNVGTVFDFDKQMKLWVGRGFNKKSEDYPGKIAEVVKLLYKKKAPGEGIVALFTSVDAMNKTEVLLGGYSIHKQHVGSPHFKENFLKDPEGILFGVKTCWTGMDIKGDKLKYLVIAGLPFECPGWEYRKVEEYLKRQGRNPFIDYSVPKMINTLRQGVGRLIRTVEDTGEVIILDSKLLSGKPYTRMVKGSMPTTIKEF